jgi:hypothetical protein
MTLVASPIRYAGAANYTECGNTSFAWTDSAPNSTTHAERDRFRKRSQLNQRKPLPMKHTQGYTIYHKHFMQSDRPWHWLVWDQVQTWPEAVYAAYRLTQTNPGFETKIVRGPIFF